MNVCNRVPLEGISLSDVLRPINCQTSLWASEVLIALDRAVELIEDAEAVRLEAERLLWAKEVKDPCTGEILQIGGLDIDGGLILREGSYQTTWTRW